MNKMISIRASEEWINHMKEAAEKTPLSTSLFIQLAAEYGSEEVINKFNKEVRNEKVRLRIQA